MKIISMNRCMGFPCYIKLPKGEQWIPSACLYDKRTDEHIEVFAADAPALNRFIVNAYKQFPNDLLTRGSMSCIIVYGDWFKTEDGLNIVCPDTVDEGMYLFDDYPNSEYYDFETNTPKPAYRDGALTEEEYQAMADELRRMMNGKND